jgi:hypothetical protein
MTLTDIHYGCKNRNVHTQGNIHEINPLAQNIMFIYIYMLFILYV